MTDSSTNLGRLENSVAYLTGRAPDELRRTPLALLRQQAESLHGHPTHITGASAASFLSSSQVNDILADALR